jgi:hypothetical protein
MAQILMRTWLNVDKVLNQGALHFDLSQVGVTARMPSLRSAR